MVNRERFMLDVDSEGFPLVDTTPFHTVLALQNLGRVPEVQIAQGLLADAKCVPCNPPGYDDIGGYPTEEERAIARRLLNEMNGSEQRAVTCAPEPTYAGIPASQISWVEEACQTVLAADWEMDNDAEDRRMNAVLDAHGITRLSDSYAPDAFYGWKR